MSLAFPTLLDQINRAGPATIADLLTAATEPERVALARDVEAHLRSMKPEDWWRPRHDPSGGYVLAVLGTMPSAARAAALLTRLDMRDKWDDAPIPHVLSVVRAREVPWLGDLAARLAAKLNPQDAWRGNWALVAALFTESGTAMPLTEGVVGGWLVALAEQDTRRRRPFVDRLRASPYLDTLLPAVFEIDGLGAHLNTMAWNMESGEWTGKLAFPPAVAELVAEGRLARKTILAATLDRLVRGDRPAWLRPFALLHDELAPTLDEQAGHALDYAQLLPGAPSAIAGIAQRALRAVDDVGRLDLDTLLEVSRPTLVRKEKTLVKAQLAWLDKVARRERDRAGEVLETVTAAFDHPALDVQERALTLIEKHSAGLDLSWLPDAATGLGGDLPARVARLCGFASAGPEPVAVVLPPPSGPMAMPAPIGSVAELAEEVVALLRDETVVRWERVLAGLVTLRGAADLSPLRHVIDREGESLSAHGWNERHTALGVAIRGILRDGPSELGETGKTWRRLIGALWDHVSRGVQSPDLNGEPVRLLALRITEIAEWLYRPSGAGLVATPTHTNGNLDAAVLVQRLRQAEADGWEPLPLDFDQALLRLPRGSDPSIADGLTSPAGRRLAAWLSGGGLPDPVSSRVQQRAGMVHSWHAGPPPAIGRVVVALDPVRPGLLSVADQLVTLARKPTMDYAAWVPEPAILAAMLPHHREVVAAWALPGLASQADQDQRGESALLPLLAENDGPFGPAMSLAVAYGLAARHESDRVAAVDAFVILAAAGTSGFGAAVGSDLGRLAALGMVKLNRAVPALADAHRACASVAVWDVVAAALPQLLPVAPPATAPGTAPGSAPSGTARGSAPSGATPHSPPSASGPRGLPDLLELASLVAAATGARGEIAGLREVAARKGNTRLLKEARRLQSVLAA